MMKQFAPALLCLLLAGCAVKPQPEPPPPPELPLRFDVLAVEFAPAGGEGQVLLGALSRFPEKLRAALAEQGVEAEELQVTLGSSQDATARAVGQGGVDVAILSAAGYAAANSGGAVELADAGRTALVCAGPSDYGRALAGRKTPTWDELNHACWGVLAAESDLGHRYVDLWLADSYEGRTLSDLTRVREYDSYEALLRAAAAGEIDLFPATRDFLNEVSDAWTMDATRSDDAGYRGFDRTEALAKEVSVLGETARAYARVAVVREDAALTGERFAAALAQALNALQEDGDRIALAGMESFAPIKDGDMDALRRLLTLEG